jgi:hypothetical protein
VSVRREPGALGRLADSMVSTLVEALREGRPVYLERLYEDLGTRFRVRSVPGSDLYRLSLREP